MNSATTFAIESKSLAATLNIAGTLGRKLRGAEVVELIGDLGSGKTAFVRGLAKGLGSTDSVQSPSFTISRIYRAHADLELHHFDFYRLIEAGVVRSALNEVISHPKVIVAVEWSQSVRAILPPSRLQITFTTTGDNSRMIEFKPTGKRHALLASVLSA